MGEIDCGQMVQRAAESFGKVNGMQQIGGWLPVYVMAFPSQRRTLHFVSLTRPYILPETREEHEWNRL